jgi:hypothetical protein
VNSANAGLRTTENTRRIISEMCHILIVVGNIYGGDNVKELGVDRRTELKPLSRKLDAHNIIKI